MSAPPASRNRAEAAWFAAALATALAVAYGNTWRVPFLMDDTPSIAANATIRHLGDLRRVLSPPPFTGVSGRPLLNLTFALNYALGGFGVAGYHAVNLLIHFLAGCALFGLLRRLLASPLAAAAVALIWAVHPLLTGSVTYLSQRAECLAGLWYLLTLYCFLRYTEGRRLPWAAASVAACLAGLATKEIVVTAPVTTLLLDAAFVSRGFRAAWRQRQTYYLCLFGTWALLAVLMLGLGRHSVGFGRGVGPGEYLLTEAHALVIYLERAVWAYPLVFDYGPVLYAWNAGTTLCGLVVLALLAATVLGWQRNPPLAFFGAWFFVLLAPTSSVIPVTLQPIAESRMYLPLVAVVALAVVATGRWLGRRAAWLWGLWALAALGATVARNQVYGSALTLWTDTEAKRPANPRAQDSLGVALAAAGRLPEALPHLAAAVRLTPRSAPIHYDYAKALAAAGNAPEAARELQQAAALDPAYRRGSGDLAAADAAFQAGRLEEARTLYQRGLAEDPGQVPARVNLGLLELQLQDFDAAGAQFQEALRLDPHDPEAHLRLGNLEAMAGRMPAAIEHWRASIQARPRAPEAHNNLGMALAQEGRRAEAAAEFRAALAADPGYAPAKGNLDALGAQPPAP